VNRSQAVFDVEGGKLIYALGALKNVGADAMRLVVEGRAGKPFATLYDFARRVDLKRIGKRPLEMLARAGAFDQLDPNRARVLASLDALVAYSAAVHDQKNSSQVSLFGEAGDDLPEPRMVPQQDWLPGEKLAEEHKAIGFYLSGHPLDDYMAPLKRKNVMTLEEVTQRAQEGPFVAKLAGSVAGRQERKSARGNRFAFAQLSDPTGLYEITIFSETLEASREHLETGMNVVVTAEATMEADQLKLLARSVAPIDSVAAQATGGGLRIFLDTQPAVAAVADLLQRAAGDPKVSRNKGPISLCLMNEALPGEVDIALGDDFPVSPQIKGAIKSLEGVVMVEDL
jgi:DNA polymerase-3 subunit alpha